MSMKHYHDDMNNEALPSNQRDEASERATYPPSMSLVESQAVAQAKPRVSNNNIKVEDQDIRRPFKKRRTVPFLTAAAAASTTRKVSDVAQAELSPFEDVMQTRVPRSNPHISVTRSKKLPGAATRKKDRYTLKGHTLQKPSFNSNSNQQEAPGESNSRYSTSSSNSTIHKQKHKTSRLSTKYEIIQEWHIVLGDTHARPDRTTIATDVLRCIKEQYKKEHKGEKRSSWIHLAIQELRKRLANETFSLDQYKNVPRQEIGLVLVKCTPKAADRIDKPNVYGYEGDSEALFGIAKAEMALEFFFESRDAPSLAHELTRHAGNLQELHESNYRPPDSMMEEFEETISFFRRKLNEVNESVLSAKLLESLKPINAMKEQWKILMKHRKPRKPNSRVRKEQVEDNDNANGPGAKDDLSDASKNLSNDPVAFPGSVKVNEQQRAASLGSYRGNSTKNAPAKNKSPEKCTVVNASLAQMSSSPQKKKPHNITQPLFKKCAKAEHELSRLSRRMAQEYGRNTGSLVLSP